MDNPRSRGFYNADDLAGQCEPAEDAANLPTSLFGEPASPQLYEDLRKRGLTFKQMADDFEAFVPYATFGVESGSPIERILLAAREGRATAAEILQRVIADISNGQFDQNWPEYMERYE